MPNFHFFGGECLCVCVFVCVCVYVCVCVCVCVCVLCESVCVGLCVCDWFGVCWLFLNENRIFCFDNDVVVKVMDPDGVGQIWFLI